jgi:tRNA 2-thiocytidine biosynthesis protein TtcA
VPVIPCGCSQKTGTVRNSLRGIFADLEKQFPHIKENMLSAMGNIEPHRLLDTRFLDFAENAAKKDEAFRILTEG